MADSKENYLFDLESERVKGVKWFMKVLVTLDLPLLKSC